MSEHQDEQGDADYDVYTFDPLYTMPPPGWAFALGWVAIAAVLALCMWPS